MAELALGEPLFNGETEIEQLFKIFKFTGSPSQDIIDLILAGNETEMVSLPTWERVYFGNLCKGKSSSELEEIVKAYIPSREQSLVKLFELKERIGEDGLDLLWLLLDLNPHTRISAEHAL